MVNAQYLGELVKESGKTKTFLASKVGCSRQYLQKKLDGEVDFKLQEAGVLANELGISSATELKKIFFA